MNDHDRDDTTLRETARRLGVHAAERLDVEHTAQAVVERLRNAPRASPWSWVQPAWLRIAAALVIVAGGALLARQVTRNGTAGHPQAHLITDDLNDLSAEQLREVWSNMDDLLNLGSTTEPEVQLEDLDAQQLRSVLRSLEG